MRRGSTLLCLLVACACGVPAPKAELSKSGKQVAVPAPVDWCSSIDAALGTAEQNFDCLQVPNFLVTGFYGTQQNPERSDFVNGCFAGEEAAAARLRMTVRPAGRMSFAYSASATVAADGVVDLGFIGAWAPSLRAEHASGQKLKVDVELEDSELRVLSSVAEILGQQYEAGELPGPIQSALESCLLALCAEHDTEPLVYTAKVLAAVPVITVHASSSRQSGGAARLLRGVAEFEVVHRAEQQQTFQLRAKDKLNVAALVEAAEPAFERALVCNKVAAATRRRELRARLRQLGLRVLAGRDLDSVSGEASDQRKLLQSAHGALSDHEQTQVLRMLESVELFAGEQRSDKPSRKTCDARALLETALTSKSRDNQLADIVTDVAQPLHERLGQIANTHALPCAEPAWYRDEDADGYGNARVVQRAKNQPTGYVANSLDCFDRNKDARPGQAAFFAAHRGDGSFDYDCDGSETAHRDLLAGGCQAITRFGIPIRCWADAGWQRRVPPCGREGQWLTTCEVEMLSCDDPQQELRRQTCH